MQLSHEISFMIQNNQLLETEIGWNEFLYFCISFSSC